MNSPWSVNRCAASSPDVRYLVAIGDDSLASKLMRISPWWIDSIPILVIDNADIIAGFVVLFDSFVAYRSIVPTWNRMLEMLSRQTTPHLGAR
jgi:hypothetical protein